MPSFPSIGLPYVKFLTNSSGSNSVTVNASAAPMDYFFDVPSGLVFIIESLCVQISDNANFNQIDYGAIAGGLSNGLQFLLRSGGVEIPLLAGQIIHHNYDWIRVTPDIKLTQWAGLSQSLIVNLNTSSRFGMPLYTSSKSDDRFILRVNDDFSTLVDHTFALGGRLIPLN